MPTAQQTYYRCEAKYGGMENGDARKMKQLEDENLKLKHVVAELTLGQPSAEGRALKKLVARCGTSGRRELCRGRVRDEQTARLQADRVGTIDASLLCPEGGRRCSANPVERVGSQAHAVRYRRLTAMRLREGVPANHERVYRLYCQEGLAMRTRQRRRIRWNGAVVETAASQPNEGWSMDFVSDMEILRQHPRFKSYLLRSGPRGVVMLL